MKTVENLKKSSVSELRKTASGLKVKNYTQYKKEELILKIIEAYQPIKQEAQEMLNVIHEKQEKLHLPKPGTKAEKMLAELKTGKKSMYQIAKELESYVSVVIGVRERYKSELVVA
jgi:hypothetical protein